MERKKIAAIGTITVVFAVLVAWTVFSIPDAPQNQDDSGKAREMEYGENTIREEIGGKLIWELKTSSSSMDIKTQATTFKDAKGRYFFEDGKELTLTAAEGSYDSKTKNVKLTGGVAATTSDGAKLTSKDLEWVAGKDRLVATGEARVSKDDTSIEADCIESWNQFQEFKATGHAHLVKGRDEKGEKKK